MTSGNNLRRKVLNCVAIGLPFSSLKENYSFGQIADAVLEADRDGLIGYYNDAYVLTEKGQEFLIQSLVYSEFKISEKYIRDDTLDIDDLYIPKYNEPKRKK